MKKLDAASTVAVLKKYRVLLFALGLLLLSLSQQQLIMPVIYDVIKSDLFLVESKDKGSDLPVSTPLSNIAFTHCNNHIKSKSAPDSTVSFSEKPLKAWDIGNYQYVISAEINLTNNAAETVTKKYVCRISYNNGDNQEGILDINNWTVVGVSDS
jgi:hypothetical protein